MILSFGTVNIKVDKFESYEALDDAHILVLYNGLMFIGGDSFAIAFDYNEHQINTLMPLPSDFVDFIYIQERRSVIIVHKKGVIVKDNECKELWRHSAGLISGYSIEGDLFIMEREDGEEIALKLKNGREVELADR